MAAAAITSTAPMSQANGSPMDAQTNPPAAATANVPVNRKGRSNVPRETAPPGLGDDTTEADGCLTGCRTGRGHHQDTVVVRGADLLVAVYRHQRAAVRHMGDAL